jgi:electron transfer flavoprotein alpha subunit
MLAYCEKREVLYELLSGGCALASQLGLNLAAVVLGPGDAEDPEPCFRYGAQRLYIGRSPYLADREVERTAEALYQIGTAHGVHVVLLGSTRRGKELAGRLAQKLGAGCVTDAIGLAVWDGRLVTQRYALGGNTVATEEFKSRVNVVAIRPRVFEAVATNQTKGEVVPVDLNLAAPRVTVVQQRSKAGEAVNLEQASVVVAVGRGLQQKEDLALVQDLAATLRGELGCSRSLCSDFGWLSEERLIGMSGKSCSPQLLVSVGVSGQIQHTVGIRGSKIIVAINKDRSAPIFNSADYGLVGDLYEIVPRLVQRLRQRDGV